MTDQIPEAEVTRRDLLKRLGRAAGKVAVVGAAGALAGCAPALAGDYSQAKAKATMDAKNAQAQDNLREAIGLAAGRRDKLLTTLFSPDTTNEKEIEILDFNLVADPRASDEEATIKGWQTPIRLEDDKAFLRVEPGNKIFIPRPIGFEEGGLAVWPGEKGLWVAGLGENGQLIFLPITSGNIDYFWAFSETMPMTKLSQLIDPTKDFPPNLVKKATMVEPLTYKIGDKSRANDPANPKQQIRLSLLKDADTIDGIVQGEIAKAR